MKSDGKRKAASGRAEEKGSSAADDAAGQRRGARIGPAAGVPGVLDAAHAAAVGRFVVLMPHAEERVVALTAHLLGDTPERARAVLAGLIGERARSVLLTSLAARSAGRIDRERLSAAFRDYAGARRSWRAYVRGLWQMRADGQVLLSVPNADGGGFLAGREMKRADIEKDVARLTALTEVLAELAASAGTVAPSPPAALPSETPAPEPPAVARKKRSAPAREPGARRRRTPPRPPPVRREADPEPMPPDAPE